MGSSYHQFCPVAKAMELFDERWTLLVVRELLLGSRRFNDVRRGLPRMSPTLLSKRLHQLVVAGIVEKQDSGNEARYVLTRAGMELRPVVEALGMWGTRWVGTLGDGDLDPALLMWDMHRNVCSTSIPGEHAVIEFHFTDVAVHSRAWWLVITPGEVDVCDVDPGLTVSVWVSTRLRVLTEIWRGDVTWSHTLESGDLTIDGPATLRRGLPSWFTLPKSAAVPRPVHDRA
ncbi:helix-turn-helix domain-containing protein [Rhodococcus sp. H36-A4]|uniref:winged helix-turn-helix transcriptional regulator n=1 Tax=Rhodococcus sp. H36-A4 TaxID=3004353 RepID=UPI0022B04918|nr:helix-turn-helix domain-containing protein [Rhodococcus sp. H36-A4]MCZ4079930.1 helix-turn-helix domain-containing protein [Rhodococcus sp. H36-A4]